MKISQHDINRSALKGYPDMLDVEQVSAILRVSSKTVYSLIKRGALFAIKPGRAYRIPKAALLGHI